MVSDALFQGWDIGTLGNTLSGRVTQDPRVDTSEASAINPTHTNVCVERGHTCAYIQLTFRLHHVW